ncbi:MAG: type 1 glutamine amidotransferase [Candidatus Heimdallarchaeota archaeon]
MIKETTLQNADVIVLEADGKIDENENGYGHVIVKRFADFNINAFLFSLVEQPQKLENLPPKPLILSGGMTGVTTDIDWVIKARELIYKTIKSNQKCGRDNHIPIFGICFGAQLIAECYSKGSVRYLDNPEIGVSRITLDFPSHPLFNGLKKQFNAYTFHYNQIQSQDVSILSSHQYNNNQFIQAFEIPNASTFGVQFHPEFAYEEMITLLRTYKNRIKNLRFKVETIIKTLPRISKNSFILKNFYSHFWNPLKGKNHLKTNFNC